MVRRRTRNTKPATRNIRGMKNDAKKKVKSLTRNSLEEYKILNINNKEQNYDEKGNYFNC